MQSTLPHIALHNFNMLRNTFFIIVWIVSLWIQNGKIFSKGWKKWNNWAPIGWIWQGYFLWLNLFFWPYLSSNPQHYLPCPIFLMKWVVRFGISSSGMGKIIQKNHLVDWNTLWALILNRGLNTKDMMFMNWDRGAKIL